MHTWLTIPVKPLDESKSRLTAVLAPEERRALTRRILQHELEVARTSNLISGIVVVSRDAALLRDVAAQGVIAVKEATSGLNLALERGRNEVLAHCADALLMLPADLPFISVKDVEQLLAPLQEGAQVVLAPSLDGGTNAMAIMPPTLMQFAFGPQSYSRHRRMAQRQGLREHVVVSQTLAFDLDRPHDWDLLRRVYPELASVSADTSGESSQ